MDYTRSAPVLLQRLRKRHSSESIWVVFRSEVVQEGSVKWQGVSRTGPVGRRTAAIISVEESRSGRESSASIVRTTHCTNWLNACSDALVRSLRRACAPGHLLPGTSRFFQLGVLPCSHGPGTEGVSHAASSAPSRRRASVQRPASTRPASSVQRPVPPASSVKRRVQRPASGVVQLQRQRHAQARRALLHNQLVSTHHQLILLLQSWVFIV